MYSVVSYSTEANRFIQLSVEEYRSGRYRLYLKKQAAL